MIGALIALITGFGWEQLKLERSFGLIILIGTLVLPMLSSLPHQVSGRLAARHHPHHRPRNRHTVGQSGFAPGAAP